MQPPMARADIALEAATGAHAASTSSTEGAARDAWTPEPRANDCSPPRQARHVAPLIVQSPHETSHGSAAEDAT